MDGKKEFLTKTQIASTERKSADKQMHEKDLEIENYVAKGIDALSDITGLCERMKKQMIEIKTKAHSAETLDEKIAGLEKIKKFNAVIETLQKINEEKFYDAMSQMIEKIQKEKERPANLPQTLN